MKELAKTWNLLQEFRKPNGHRFAVIEGNRACNRRCSYCAVPQQYTQEQELTIEETFRTVDWLYAQGYRLLSWIGGEPLAPFETKEGIAFFDHTIQVVDYASSKGMVVNVTTNGDYVTDEKVHALKNAGLDSLTCSLHTYTKSSLDHVVNGAKQAARERIIPAIQTVLSSKTAEHLPGIAAYAAQNGLFFSFGFIQENGGGFSKAPHESLIPTQEQQQKTLTALGHLKRFGFVRNNTNYLNNASDYYPNNWTCDPDQDTFIHIGAGGTIDVCSDVRTSIHISEIPLLSESEQWRDIKREKVAHCGNCLYHCYYEAENPHLSRDVPMIGLSSLIKAGRADQVERWGKFAVSRIKSRHKNVNWELEFGVCQGLWNNF